MAAKPQTLLVQLLGQDGRVVAVDHLEDEIGQDGSSRSAGNLLRQYESQLRKRLLTSAGRSALSTHPSVYLLQLQQGDLDRDSFDSLVGRAQQRSAAVRSASASTWRRMPSTSCETSEVCFRFAHIYRLFAQQLPLGEQSGCS